MPLAINNPFPKKKKKKTKSQLSSEQKHVCICNPTVFVFSGKSANMIPWEINGTRADTFNNWVWFMADLYFCKALRQGEQGHRWWWGGGGRQKHYYVSWHSVVYDTDWPSRKAYILMPGLGGNPNSATLRPELTHEQKEADLGSTCQRGMALKALRFTILEKYIYTYIYVRERWQKKPGANFQSFYWMNEPQAMQETFQQNIANNDQVQYKNSS